MLVFRHTGQPGLLPVPLFLSALHSLARHSGHFVFAFFWDGWGGGGEAAGKYHNWMPRPGPIDATIRSSAAYLKSKNKKSTRGVAKGLKNVSLDAVDIVLSVHAGDFDLTADLVSRLYPC